MTKKNFKRKIITAEEFFRLKEMFMGIEEDQAIAVEVYKNSGFADKEIVDLLMAKALVFEPRRKFCDAIKFTFNLPSNKEIYAYMEEYEAEEVYYKILRDMGYDK